VPPRSVYEDDSEEFPEEFPEDNKDDRSYILPDSDEESELRARLEAFNAGVHNVSYILRDV
jgi:hypothetical protein